MVKDRHPGRVVLFSLCVPVFTKKNIFFIQVEYVSGQLSDLVSEGLFPVTGNAACGVAL